MELINKKLRVVHFPQIGSCKESFKIDVKDEYQAFFAMHLMAKQHIWLEMHRIIPDYSNVILVEMYDNDIEEETGKPYGWIDYYNDKEEMDWSEIEETYFTNNH